MRKAILTILILLVCRVGWGEKYYVFIDKIGIVQKGQEAGQTEYGDVVAISPFESQYKPTKAELSRYKVIVMDLDEEDKETLFESELENLEEDSPTVIKARKKKIKIDELTTIKQEEVIDDKAVIFNKISVKPVSISVVDER